MAGHSNIDHEYQEDGDTRQYQYLYNSQRHSAQVPKSNYLYTNQIQDFAIDDQSHSTDVVMQEFASEYHVASAETYNGGWHNSVGTGASVNNVNTPGSTTDAGMSSYVVLEPQRSRTYSENSSGQGSDGPLFSAVGDVEPWTHGSAFEVDREAMEEDAQVLPMPYDQHRALAGLSSPGMYPSDDQGDSD